MKKVIFSFLLIFCLSMLAQGNAYAHDVQAYGYFGFPFGGFYPFYNPLLTPQVYPYYSNPLTTVTPVVDYRLNEKFQELGEFKRAVRNEYYYEASQQVKPLPKADPEIKIDQPQY